MAAYLNPAGRLHHLLTRFADHPDHSIQAAWAEVLEVAEADIVLHLGEVGTLLPAVRNAASETEMDAFDPIAGHLTTLSQSIFPVSVPFSQPAREVVPDATAMQMLNALSAYLEETAPEGKLPEPDEVAELRLAFAELLRDVIDAELPPDIRRALVHRLNEMINALDHLNVGGPDAVRRAAEALAISALLYEADAQDDSAVFTRLRSAAQKTWVAFTVVITLANAVVTFDRITGMEVLPPAQEQRQLPSGSPSRGGANPPDQPPDEDGGLGPGVEQV